jgi:hypothetical protein
MLRISAVTIALLLVAGPAALAQLPPQPPPVQGMSINGGTDQERAACHPDVVRFCKSLIHENGQDDVFAILGCLQSNRSKISGACQQVLASHGQ